MNPLAASLFAGLLERATGQQLAPARRWRIEALLGPLVRARGLETLDHLAARLHAAAPDDPPLAEAVVEALLNHETSFFRDTAAFATLIQEALPALAAARPRERRLRLWSAGCATGQEAYSLALAIAGDPVRWAGWDIEILGTDVSADAIARAIAGRYSRFEIERGLSEADLRTHFEPIGREWRARPGLCRRVTFRRHNLLHPPPPGAFDVVLCRNVLLYFPPARQRAVLGRLAAALAPDGLLMLGAGETAREASDLLVAAPDLRGLYRRVPKAAR